MACEESRSFMSTSIQNSFIMTDILLRAGVLSRTISFLSCSWSRQFREKQSSFIKVMILVCKPDKYNAHVRIYSSFIGIIFQEFSMSVAHEYIVCENLKIRLFFVLTV